MRKLAVIIVGSSGTGKSTFIDSMGIPSSAHYVTSQPMIEELVRRGEDVNHDTIFALSEDLYGKDPYWQVPLIIKVLDKEKLVLVDGPRRLPEVLRLKETCPTIIIGIESSSKGRYERLKRRKKINLETLEEFERLEKDESKSMDVDDLMELIDIKVHNDGEKEEIQRKGKRLREILRMNFLPRSVIILLLRLAFR